MNLLFWIIIILLLFGWGFGAFYFAAGGFIHILLFIVIIAVLFRLINGRRF